jgi:HSP20 family protein
MNSSADGLAGWPAPCAGPAAAVVVHNSTKIPTIMRLIRYSYPAVLSPAVSAFQRSPWLGFEHEIDRMFETALDGFGRGNTSTRFPVDLFEDKANNYVRAELPGVRRDDIQVEMADGYLTLTATRKAATADKGEETVSFSRSIHIEDEVQADKVEAVYENGVLTVTLPKREEAKPKKITVAVK